MVFSINIIKIINESDTNIPKKHMLFKGKITYFSLILITVTTVVTMIIV